MVLSSEFKEKLSSCGLDDASTIQVLHTLQVQHFEDISCFSEEDFVDAGMKLFKARKLMQLFDVANGGTQLTQRQRSSGNYPAQDYRKSSFHEHRSDSFKKRLQQQQDRQQGKDPTPPRQPFLGRTSSGKAQSQRLSSREPPRKSTAQASFSSEALLLKRANSAYDPRRASGLQAEEVKKTGRASISQHPMVRQELEAAERLEQEQLLRDQAERRKQLLKMERSKSMESADPLSPKDMYLQKQRQRQKQEQYAKKRGDNEVEFHGQEHIVYEYHNYSSLHPNDRPPLPSNQRARSRGSTVKAADAESLLEFMELEDGGRGDRGRNARNSIEAVFNVEDDGRNARGSMELMGQQALFPPPPQLDVHEADYCFEEATNAFNQQQFDRALGLSGKAVDIYKQIWKQTPQGKFPPDQAHTCFTLYTELLRRASRLEDAEKNCKSLVKLERKFCGVNHLMTADAMFMMGKIQLELQKFDHAAYAIGEALRVQMKHEKDHVRTASGFYYLGLVFQVQESYEKSLPCFSEAVRIFTKCVGAQQSDTAEALHGMSTVLYKQGNLEKSRESFFKTLTTKIAVYGKDHVSTADTLLNASMVLRDQGNLKEAFKYATKSYEVLGKVFGGEHERTLEAGDHLDHLHDLLDQETSDQKQHKKNQKQQDENNRGNGEEGGSLQVKESEPLVEEEEGEPRMLGGRAPRNSISL